MNALVATPTAAAVKATLTKPVPRWYQVDLETAANSAWYDAGPTSVVCAVLPTGGGKTVFFGMMVDKHDGYSICIAHRQELVSQISMTLARYGVRHRIIAPPEVQQAICKEQLEELGLCFVDPNAKAAVAGVDTLNLRMAKDRELQQFAKRVTLWVQDEGHHVLKTNKWGTAASHFPNAKGLLVTATPCRADGKGLGRHADGLADVLVVGPTMRQLIDWGYLTDYKIVGAEVHFEGIEEAFSKKTGDLILDRGKGKEAVRKSPLVGDMVKTYLQWVPGKLGISFLSDVETAGDVAERFRQAGIPAEMVDGTTPGADRGRALKAFKTRKILELTNVDLFGEGFDLPAVEVVQMGRKTLSFSLYAQQFGRALRLMIDSAHQRVWDTYTVEQRKAIIAASPKPFAWIIDHVGNVLYHGLPDAKNDWTLDASDKRSEGADDAEKLTYCLNPQCGMPYLRIKPKCPHCSQVPEVAPEARKSPGMVDGNMRLLDEETLAMLRGQVAQVQRSDDEFMRSMLARKVPPIGRSKQLRAHRSHKAELELLQAEMAWWAGGYRAEGACDEEIFKRFYLTFKVDWMNAQALPETEMQALRERIENKLTPAASLAKLEALLQAS